MFFFQIHLDELQKNQKQTSHMVGINMEGSLYKQPLMVSLMVILYVFVFTPFFFPWRICDEGRLPENIEIDLSIYQ